MGPLIPQGIIAMQWDLVIAVLIGFAFGFILESSGFSSTRKLAGVFYGYDMVVLKVFFTAAITAMLGLLYFDYLGWIDINLIYVNPTFIYSSITGGVIMGIGFIMGGYCPGTSFTGVAIGKIDAMVFTVGMFIGVLLFSESFPLFEKFYYSGDMGSVKITETLGISAPLFVMIVIVIAIPLFYVAGMIEKRVKKVNY